MQGGNWWGEVQGAIGGVRCRGAIGGVRCRGAIGGYSL